MAYINKVSAVVAVLFLVVVIAPQLAQAQDPMFPKMDPKCVTMTDILEKCFSTGSVTPTAECCSDLKSATTTQVTCLCDNYIANPSFATITGPYSAEITTKCGVFDKFSCTGTSKGGEGSSSNTNNTGNSSNGKEGNGGGANTVAASMAIFGLISSFFFVMF